MPRKYIKNFTLLNTSDGSQTHYDFPGNTIYDDGIITYKLPIKDIFNRTKNPETISIGDKSLVTTLFYPPSTGNTAIGHYSLRNNQTGNHNTAVGNSSLRSINTGSYNIGIGYKSGEQSSPYLSNSIIIGNNSNIGTIATGNTIVGNNISSYGATNEIIVGYGASGKGSNTVVLGNDSIIETWLKGKVITNQFASNQLASNQLISKTADSTSLSYSSGTIVSSTVNQFETLDGTGTLTLERGIIFNNVGVLNYLLNDINYYLEYSNTTLDETTQTFSITKIFYIQAGPPVNVTSFSILEGTVIIGNTWPTFSCYNPTQGTSTIHLFANSNIDDFAVGDSLKVNYVDYLILSITRGGDLGGYIVTCNGTIPYTNNVFTNKSTSVSIVKNTLNYTNPSIEIIGNSSFSPFNDLKVNSNIIPRKTTLHNLGSASNLWKEVFASNGVINTSDARLKTEISPLTQDELNATKQLSKEMGTYKFLAAVAEKGDAARKHLGMTVQRAIEIMTENNLNPFEYGFICYDKWNDEFKKVIDIESIEYKAAWVEEILGDEGEEPTIINHPEVPAVEEVSHQEQTKVAGDTYSFRYTELLAFICRGFEERLSILENY